MKLYSIKYWMTQSRLTIIYIILTKFLKIRYINTWLRVLNKDEADSSFKCNSFQRFLIAWVRIKISHTDLNPPALGSFFDPAPLPWAPKQMYKSYLGDLTNIMFTVKKSKKSDRRNKSTPVGFFLSLEPCRSGAGSKKDPSAAGEVPWIAWRNTWQGGTRH